MQHSVVFMLLTAIASIREKGERQKGREIEEETEI